MLIFGLLGFLACLILMVVLGRPLLSSGNDAASRRGRLSALGFLALVPIMTGLLYIEVGTPAAIKPLESDPVGPLTADPGEIAAMSPDERGAMIETMVASLETRLSENPTDIEGWRMLARSQTVLGRYDDSFESFGKLFELVEGSADDWRNYAGVFIAQSPEGIFPGSDGFLKALDEIEARAPGDPFSRFYRGGALLRRGEKEAALSVWQPLRADLPSEAPLSGVLDALIAQTQEASLPDENTSEPKSDGP